jgi:hypothetical protein
MIGCSDPPCSKGRVCAAHLGLVDHSYGIFQINNQHPDWHHPDAMRSIPGTGSGASDVGQEGEEPRPGFAPSDCSCLSQWDTCEWCATTESRRESGQIQPPRQGEARPSPQRGRLPRPLPSEPLDR